MRDKTSSLDVSLLLSWWEEEQEQGCVEEEDDEFKEVEEKEERENDEEEGISRWFSANQLFRTGQASFLYFSS